MDASGSGSGGEKEKDKGKGKEIENDSVKRKQIWLGKVINMFEMNLPLIVERERVCRRIAAQYDVKEHYAAWLQNLAQYESDDDNHSVRGREATQQQEQENRSPVQGQENAPDIAMQQLQEMQQDDTRNAEEKDTDTDTDAEAGLSNK